MLVKYYVIGTNVYILPHWARMEELAKAFDDIRPSAIGAMKSAGKTHAIYAAKTYDPETGAVDHVNLYNPPVVLDDAEFDRRTSEFYREHPGSVILAVHAMT